MQFSLEKIIKFIIVSSRQYGTNSSACLLDGHPIMVEYRKLILVCVSVRESVFTTYNITEVDGNATSWYVTSLV